MTLPLTQNVVKKRTPFVFQSLKVKTCGKWLKGLEDSPSALSILLTKIPPKINHVFNNDANQWFRKLLKKLQKETTQNTSCVYRSTCWNTIQQGIDVWLNFFGSIRKVPTWHFFGREILLLGYFEEGNCDAFDDNIVDMLSYLATQYESYKQKAQSGKPGKTPQYWLTYLDSYIYKEWLIVPYKKKI